MRKSNGEPLFLLANVVDDADMRITHVIRGEDHVSNTHKYVLLWEALGYGPLPVFAHLPLLFNESRQKLSKRRDKVAVEDYRDEGYLPEAMRNYLALLGWSPGGTGRSSHAGDDRRIPARRRQERPGHLRRAEVAGGQRRVPPGAANHRAGRSSPGVATLRWESLAPLVQERARTLGQVYGMTDFLYLPSIVVDPGEWAKASSRPEFGPVLKAAAKRFADIDWTASEIEAATVAAGTDAGVEKTSKAQAPVRLAVTGRAVGPPLWESLEVLGR